MWACFSEALDDYHVPKMANPATVEESAAALEARNSDEALSLGPEIGSCFFWGICDGLSTEAALSSHY
jgi:hypothetical protein